MVLQQYCTKPETGTHGSSTENTAKLTQRCLIQRLILCTSITREVGFSIYAYLLGVQQLAPILVARELQGQPSDYHAVIVPETATLCNRAAAFYPCVLLAGEGKMLTRSGKWFSGYPNAMIKHAADDVMCINFGTSEFTSFDSLDTLWD